VANRKERAARLALSFPKLKINPSVDTPWPNRPVSIGEALTAHLNVIFFASFDSSKFRAGCRVFVTPLSIEDIEYLRQFGSQVAAQFAVTARPITGNTDRCYSFIFPSAVTRRQEDFLNTAKAYFLSKKLAHILNRETLSAYTVKLTPSAAELAARPTFAFQFISHPAHEFAIEPDTSMHYTAFKFIDPQLKKAAFKPRSLEQY